MSGEVRVLVYYHADDPEGVLTAYHAVSEELAEVEGMLGNELLTSVLAADSFAVLSRWRDLASFQIWERGNSHKGSTAALRPFQDTRMGTPFGVYEVSARH
ncbi:antibiotic biosynthesis monooxygenase [Nocardia sp. CDC153]|uniref:antibiotic biosynthesis monooxygenase family protein n=1 Tax=Nocardia sp. CDC153 TaxID=3112167 RepID=UPI002DBE7857|nr:antibiotic biosynthesis monooxygenase [Nocardia sp. CDC153]MEC3952025.1 antibiotic biosynthesis monooxygenase [Nocardia sp. CDC153]